jgi:hypothetical protein
MQEGLEQDAEQLLIRGTGKDVETFLDRKDRAGSRKGPNQEGQRRQQRQNGQCEASYI